jgi:hypothetical protein
MARIHSTAKMMTLTSSGASKRNEDAPAMVELGATMSIFEAMRVMAEDKVVEQEGILEENFLEAKEDDNDLRRTKPSHVEFGESTVKPSDFDVMKKIGYICEKDGVRFASCQITLQLNDDMIMVFRSFFRARLKLPIFMIISKVLKKYEIYMHQLTPNVIGILSIYIWAMRSQGVSASAEAFCGIHEPHYQTNVRPSDGLHYNFGCYNFAYRKV